MLRKTKIYNQGFAQLAILGGVALAAFVSGVMMMYLVKDRSSTTTTSVSETLRGYGHAHGQDETEHGPRGRAKGLLMDEITQASPAPITDEEKAGLVKMREEEKLARDVYLTLAKESDLRVFSNIAGAEQQHMDAIEVLLDKYGIDDPVKSDSVGAFTDPKMKELYDQLVAQGKTGAKEALTVGATIEDLDIYDLEELMAKTKNPDIISVYERLVAGSEYHMRAFTRNLANLGESYKPQYISQERFEEIVSDTNSQGRGGQGQGANTTDDRFGGGRRGGRR